MLLNSYTIIFSLAAGHGSSWVVSIVSVRAYEKKLKTRATRQNIFNLLTQPLITQPNKKRTI